MLEDICIDNCLYLDLFIFLERTIIQLIMSKLTIKDFDLSLEVDAAERAELFQQYINQLDEEKCRAYWIEAIGGIKSQMTIRDIYSGKEKEIISFITNDYLGMSQNEEVIAAGIEAMKKYGTGACAAPVIGGYTDAHKKLEEDIAAFTGQEDAIVFSSGFGTNVGVLNALLGKNDIALVDTFIHVSLTEGLHTTNTKNIGHNNLEYLESTLKNVQDKYKTKMVIIDGLYSQDGDLALLPDIIKLCKQYGALLTMDDAHGIGVLGAGGRGTAEHYNVLGQVDIITGTFSKAFGCVGGFAAGSKKMIQYLKYYAKSNIFSTAMTPQVAASARKVIDVIRTKPEIRAKLWDNVHYLKKRLIDEGFDIGKTVSPIFPVMVRNDYKVQQASAALQKEGIYALGIIYPAVSKKEARIRVNIQATHKKEHLDYFVNSLCKIDTILKLRN